MHVIESFHFWDLVGYEPAQNISKGLATAVFRNKDRGFPKSGHADVSVNAKANMKIAFFVMTQHGLRGSGKIYDFKAMAFQPVGEFLLPLIHGAKIAVCLLVTLGVQ